MAFFSVGMTLVSMVVIHASGLALIAKKKDARLVNGTLSNNNSYSYTIVGAKTAAVAVGIAVACMVPMFKRYLSYISLCAQEKLLIEI